jgi:threonine/homoserine/homoserine lactone efflux protein
MNTLFDTAVLLSFAIHWMAIVPSPGPNQVLVLHVATSRPPVHVVWAVTGNLIGMMLLAAIALAGWAALLEAFPWLRRSVNVFGGSYLIYIGWRLFEAYGKARTAKDPGDALADPASVRRSVTDGFLTAIANVQASLFITSIYAATGVLQANLATGFAAIAIMIACNASYLGGLGWLCLRAPIRSRYMHYRKYINLAMGALFVGFGLRLLLSELLV